MSRGLILAIESSCDETAAAVVQRGAHTLSSVVASQIATHARYGGVVPELASREHLRAIVPVVRAALAQANITLADLDAIAVTSGPGLAGALLVGITYAKALSFAANLPLIAVNHLEGHIHAVLLNEREASPYTQSPRHGQPETVPAPIERTIVDGPPCQGTTSVVPQMPKKDARALAPAEQPANPNPPGAPCLASETWEAANVNPPFADSPNAAGAPSFPRFFEKRTAERVGEHEPQPAASEPALALVVSGGHTHLYLARPTANTWHYTLVGRTLDDAAGEAYDKVAKLLGLGYPGGPWIDALAQFGNPHAVPFAFSQIKPKLHLAGKAPRTKGATTSPIAHLDPHFLFSFSGIKTAVLRYVELHHLRPEAQARAARLFPPQPSHLPQTCHPERAQRVEGPAVSGLSAPQKLGAPGLASETRESTNLNPVSAHHPQTQGAPAFPRSSAERVGAHEPQPALPSKPGAPGPAPETWESDDTNRPALTPPSPPKNHAEALALCPQPTLDLIASFQHAVVGDLLKKTFAAAEALGARRILVTGGVAANRELRARFTAEAARRNQLLSHPERNKTACHPERRQVACHPERRELACHPERPRAQRGGVDGPPVAFSALPATQPFEVSFPTLALSTDNAAMIAAAAWPRLLTRDFAPPGLSANPSLALGR